MKSCKSFEPIYIALGLILGFLVDVFGYPAIDPYNYELQDPQVSYALGYAREQPYVRLDSSPLVYQIDDPNKNYFHPQIPSMMPLDRDLYANMPVFQRAEVPYNGVDPLLVDGVSFYHSKQGGRSSNDDKLIPSNIDPEFLNAVYSALIQKDDIFGEPKNHTDNINTRNTDKDIDPSMLNEIRALILNIMKQEQANALIRFNNTDYLMDQSFNSSDYEKRLLNYNSGYVLHPMPVPVVQTIPEASFAESAVYNGNPNVYSDQQSLFGIPSRPFPIFEPLMTYPTQTLPTKPFESSKPSESKPSESPSSTSGSSTVVSSAPGQDSFYLQPMYSAPVPMPSMLFPYWPVAYSDASKVQFVNLNTNPPNEDSQKVDTKPIETNLTKYNIDPVTTEKKSKIHLTVRGGSKDKMRVNQNSRNPLSARSVPDYDDSTLDKRINSNSPQRFHRYGISARSISDYDDSPKRINSNSLYRSSKNAFSAKSPPDYDDSLEDLRRGPSQPNIPLVQKVLVPLNPTNGMMQSEQGKPRYRVTYELQKTYVPY